MRKMHIMSILVRACIVHIYKRDNYAVEKYYIYSYKLMTKLID